MALQNERMKFKMVLHLPTPPYSSLYKKFGVSDSEKGDEG